MFFKKVTANITLPEPLYTWLNTKAAKENITFSHAIVRTLLPALGQEPNTYDNNMRKPGKRIQTTSQVQFNVDPIYEQVPLNMMELANQPYRKDHVYDILLSLGWAGNEDGSIKPSKTTVEEQQNIKQLRKLYSIKN